MEKGGRTHDLYGEKDIPKSNILNIELYMDKHAKEIVDFIEQEITDNSRKVITMTGKIPDRIMNELSKEMPFGPSYDMTHSMLTDALITSLWCGWLSQSMVNRKEEKFNEQYVEQFKRAITRAYDIGKKYANAQKLNESSKERC